MATRRRSAPTEYRTYGNVAYAPVYEGNTVRAPRRQEVERPQPKRRPHRRHIVRPQVEVRQAGSVSVFAVVGFLAVGVFAALLLLSYVQLTMTADSVRSLRSELSQLQADNVALTAQYEQVFDMEHLQQAVGGTMTRATGSQITYIDLSEPDSVVLHNQTPAGVRGVQGLIQGAEEIFSALTEYFR